MRINKMLTLYYFFIKTTYRFYVGLAAKTKSIQSLSCFCANYTGSYKHAGATLKLITRPTQVTPSYVGLRLS